MYNLNSLKMNDFPSTFDYNQPGFGSVGGSSMSKDSSTQSFPEHTKIADRMIDYLSRDNVELKSRNKVLEERIDSLTGKLQELKDSNLELQIANNNLQNKFNVQSMLR